MKLSIDLGGTNIRIAQVENGVCLNKTSVPCMAQQDANTVIGQLSGLIESQLNGQVAGIGIGVPSIVDSQKGIVYNVANIASWKEIHLKEILESKFGIPVAIENDSNCFALGTHLFGEGRPYDHMVGITIGTGIGAGIIVDGRLYGGQYRGAGEIGSLPYLDADYEHYCSSFFFKRYQSTGADLARRAADGEAEAQEIWDTFGMHLGNLMKSILFAYAPQAIVLGGGIAAGFPFFRKAMEDVINGFPYKIIAENTRIIQTKLQDASLLGASALIEE